MGVLMLLAILAVMGILAYQRAALPVWSGILFLSLVLLTWAGHTHWALLTVYWILFLVVTLPLMIVPLRRRWFSQNLYRWYRQQMPKMSNTEKEALEAGTTSWEAELFSGKPRWSKLLKIPAPRLTAEEQAFMDGPVDTLCKMSNDWDITHNLTDMPPEMWQFIKDHGFWGLIIPKRYGGKEFSAYAHSEILIKLCGVSITVGTTVSVPNSLGPGELLLHYGTEAQKNYYLPRLARGEDIPCFALTSPVAGSDASSIPDTGIVCRGEFEGKSVIGIRLNWDKRYITLAPIATILGLAFKLYDPEKLLGGQIDYGITCALIPTTTPGITIGRRHFPLNTAFLNGPTQGNNVFIPIDWIIGGAKMAGQGWRMLMECLSAGRAISLPSTGVGGSKMTALMTGAYARIRKQFSLPIGRFEGVSEVLARMAGEVYLMDSARQLTLAVIDQGGKPAVLSAIMKYHATEAARRIACDAMDVHGGKGICLGPRNYLARLYQGVPIGITVEGANILTRNLIIFGQGAIRCHRYVLAELQAAQDTDTRRGVVAFDRALFGHIGLIVSNLCRTFWLGLTGARLARMKFAHKSVRRYYQLLMRFSTAFSLLSDMAMSVLGGELKRRERLSARLGDILSYLYLISGALKRYAADGYPPDDAPLVHWACQTGFQIIQQRFGEILENFPHAVLAKVLRVAIFPLGKVSYAPRDRLSQQVADILLSPSATRDRLLKNIFHGNMVGQMEDALRKVIAAEPVAHKLQQAVRDNVLEQHPDAKKICDEARNVGIINAEEAALWYAAEAARAEIIAVDDFAHEELARR